MFPNDKFIMVVWNGMVSMATRNAILKNEELKLEHLTWYQINSKT